MNVQSKGRKSTHRVFISFTSADKVLAEYLADELRRSLDDYNAVFCFTRPGTQDSQAGSRPSDDFPKRIDDRLRKCNVFILLWSEAAKREGWVNYEFGHAKRFHIKEARRMGKLFKLIPISIDKCSLPFGISHIVRLSYTSGDDMQETLNQVLSALALPREHDDPNVVFLKNARFQIKTAFENKEWPDVVQKYPNLAINYPSVVSATTHYRYAIALLMLERTEHSFQAVCEGLTMNNKEDDAVLLEQYMQHLKGKRQWNKLQLIAEQAIVKFPLDARWHHFKWEAVNHTNTDPSFFLPPNSQQIQQASQLVSAGVNGANGATMTNINSQTAPFIPLQQYPSLSQHNVLHGPHDFSSIQQFGTQIPEAENHQVSPNDQPHVTRKLTEEELQSEMESSSLQKADAFTEKYVSYHKIEKLLSLFMIFLAILNIFYIAFISVLFPLNTHLVIPEAIGLLIILGTGRLAESEAIRFLCIAVLLVFWAISGYGCGCRLYDYFNWGAENSLRNCIGIITAIITITVGGRCHLHLFYNKK